VAIDGPREKGPVATIDLHDSALSVSAGWGKSFELGGRKYGHVIDPRTGWPVDPSAGATLAAVGLESAMETDALSTALLVAGGGPNEITRLRPKMAWLTLRDLDGAFQTSARNIPVCGA